MRLVVLAMALTCASAAAQTPPSIPSVLPAPPGNIGRAQHALAYAPGVEMSRQIEAERARVPIAGG
jgi:hypothetical protein